MDTPITSPHPLTPRPQSHCLSSRQTSLQTNPPSLPSGNHRSIRHQLPTACYSTRAEMPPRRPCRPRRQRHTARICCPGARRRRRFVAALHGSGPTAATTHAWCLPPGRVLHTPGQTRPRPAHRGPGERVSMCVFACGSVLNALEKCLFWLGCTEDRGTEMRAERALSMHTSPHLNHPPPKDKKIQIVTCPP